MKFLKFLLKLLPLGAAGAVMVAAGVYLHLGPSLPSVEVLKDVRRGQAGAEVQVDPGADHHGAAGTEWNETQDKLKEIHLG